MGLYKYLKELNRDKEKIKPLMKSRLISWRRENAVVKIENPTNLLAARSLGYRAKKGIIIARVRVKRGGKQRPHIKKGRRSRHKRQKFVMGKSFQWIAEERAAKHFPSLEVLNSYKIGKDGQRYWFEVILVDRNHPSIKNDPKLNWICRPANKERVFRGLTSAGRKSRGLLSKGKGAEKIRPSLRANLGRGK